MKRKIFNELTLMTWQEIDAENWQTLVSDICNIFFEVTPTQLNLLNQSWSEKNINAVKKSAHTLKSSCGNVGAEEAQDLLERIEKAAMQQDEIMLNSLMEQINPLFKQSSLLLEEFLKKNQAA